MRYSLLNRFEGCLLGAAVAFWLGASYEKNAKELHNYAWFGVENLDLGQSVLMPQGMILQKAVAESLIKQGIVQTNFWNLGDKHFLDVVDVVLGTLPLTLYLHEQELKKKLSLQEACLNLPNGEVTQQIVLALGYGISLALQEKRLSSLLIGETVERLKQDVGDAECALAKQLNKIESLLEDYAGLERLLQVVGRDSVKGQMAGVAIGFSSFAMYPEDFRLCVIRALRAGKSPKLAAVIAGALCGAYVGVAGIPVAWSEAVNRLELGLEGMPVRQMAGRLFAAWSGVYQNEGSMIETGRFDAIAASELLRRL